VDHLLLAITVLFHPVDTFRMIKRDRSRLTILPSLILIGLMLFARVIYILICHYPLSLVDRENMVLWQELASYLIVLFSFVVMYYACTSIIGGEVYSREALLAVSLSTVPYTIFMPILGAFSHLMGKEQAGIYYGLIMSVWVWVMLLVISSVYTMNSYSPAQTVFVLLCTVISVFIFWAVCMLIYALCNQVLGFIGNLLQEIRIRFSI